MYIIEKDTDLSLINPNDTKLIIPIWSSNRGHELGFPISFVYIRTKDTEYILNFQHIDANHLKPFDISKLCNEDTLVMGNRYVGSKGYDYEYIYFEHYGIPFIQNEFFTEVYKGYRTNYTELNDCIPLLKWYEVLTKVPMITDIRSWYRRYSHSITQLGRMEGAGVQVVEQKFIDSFSFPPEYIDGGRVYTKYNPYTTTGRPSNRHLNVNWSALNKSDGTRSLIVSRFDGGSLLQMDYESYHIRLIAKMVGYQFPKGETAHQHLADLYGTDYETAKGLTFKYLYGGLDDFARGIPYFQKVEKYIEEIYQNFVISGRLTTPLFKREIHHTKIEGSTQQKVFNYLLQALETEINYLKIEEVLNWLEGRKSKLILYTYDAFLIDTHPDERDGVLETLPTIMEKGEFPIRTYEGTNYDNLEIIR
jgi:hypothetical protein